MSENKVLSMFSICCFSEDSETTNSVGGRGGIRTPEAGKHLIYSQDLTTALGTLPEIGSVY